MSMVENMNLEEIDKDHMDHILPYLERPHSTLCYPPLTWKERFAYEALQWYNKNKAHDNFAHYKIVRTLMANKVHHEGEYYCHVNFVAIDTVCSAAMYALFFAELKLSQDAISNEVLTCCILTRKAWTGCLNCPSDLEILHPPPSEYNVGRSMDNVSPGSLSEDVTEDTFDEYLYGRTPSMVKCAYPVGRLCISFSYRDSTEGSEIRSCLEEHYKKMGEKYRYVKMTTCESIVPDDSIWRHYNFIAMREDVSNAKMELLFAERRSDADPDAPVSVCYSLGPATLVSVERKAEFGGYYKITTPRYRRGISGRACCCAVKHPGDPDMYTMQRKQPRYFGDEDEEDVILAAAEAQTTLRSPAMQSNNPSSSSCSPSTPQSPERSTSADAQEPNMFEDVDPTDFAAKRRKVQDVP